MLEVPVNYSLPPFRGGERLPSGMGFQRKPGSETRLTAHETITSVADNIEGKMGSSAEFVGECAVILVEKRRDGKL